MKIDMLTRNADFTRAYKAGKSYVSKAVVIYYRRTKGKRLRVGITTSKKIGNAVVRNRARRVIRHALYTVLPKQPAGGDYVFVARGMTPRMRSYAVAAAIERELRKAGLLGKEEEKSRPEMNGTAAPGREP